MIFIRYFFFLSLLLFVACKSTNVVYFNNPVFEEASYQTYKIITFPSDSLAVQSGDIYGQVSQHIELEMNSRGFTSKPKGSELVVRYDFHSTHVDKSRVNRNFNSFNNFGNPLNPNFINIQERKVNESILLIDIYDRKSRKLVWQASLDLNVPVYKKKKLDELIPTAVSEIFKTFQTPSN